MINKENLESIRDEKKTEIHDLMDSIDRRMESITVENWFHIAVLHRVITILREADDHLPRLE